MEHALEQSLRMNAKKVSELQNEFKVSQPTLSRALTKLEKQGRILHIGSARATRYAAVRTSVVLREGALPIYEVDEQGAVTPVATLTPIYPNQFAVIPKTKNIPSGFPIKPELHPSLPYYLQSVRPEGFLGRLTAAKANQILRLPTDPRDWSEDEVLFYAANFGDDLPGALIIGETSVTQFLSHKPQLDSLPETALFAHKAERVETGEPVGSSAGGEQPKFTVLVKNSSGDPCHAIVKFSSTAEHSAAGRWRDLLIAEYLALETLRKFDLPASTARLVTSGMRVFLVIERFDRVGVRGRKHYFALGALDDALHGDRRSVRKSAQYFYENRFISETDLKSITLISLFGDLIGNTDQHFGNTSFTWVSGHLALAPAYDVLPMWYAPRSQGTLPQGLHPLKPILPEFNAFKKQLSDMAQEFWLNVKGHSAISSEFRKIANENLSRFI